jgi:hypothetical protein
MAELASSACAQTPPRPTPRARRLLSGGDAQRRHQVTFVTPSTCDVLHIQRL